MNAVAAKSRKKTIRKALWHVGDLLPREILAFCPACKALEVVRFTGAEMVPTRKFVQKRDRVYHACGSDVPCRLHSSIGRNQPAGARHDSLAALTAYASRRARSRTMVGHSSRRAKLPAAA